MCIAIYILNQLYLIYIYIYYKLISQQNELGLKLQMLSQYQ